MELPLKLTIKFFKLKLFFDTSVPKWPTEKIDLLIPATFVFIKKFTNKLGNKEWIAKIIKIRTDN